MQDGRAYLFACGMGQLYDPVRGLCYYGSPTHCTGPRSAATADISQAVNSSSHPDTNDGGFSIEMNSKEVSPGKEYGICIIKTATNNQNKSNSMLMMEIEGELTTHHQTIAEKFNTYYISVADNITNNNQAKDTVDDLNKKDPLHYLYSAFQQSFTSIKLKNTTTGEIEKITVKPA
jgi:hypothetical protein